MPFTNTNTNTKTATAHFHGVPLGAYYFEAAVPSYITYPAVPVWEYWYSTNDWSFLPTATTRRAWRLMTADGRLVAFHLPEIKQEWKPVPGKPGVARFAPVILPRHRWTRPEATG